MNLTTKHTKYTKTKLFFVHFVCLVVRKRSNI